MLTLGIRYLNGFVTASMPDSYDDPEWPPHPARVFMALAAVHFATGADPNERAALQWLEALPPPTLRVPRAFGRKAVTHYVPINDPILDEQSKGSRRKIASRELSDTPMQSIPQLTRRRKPRTFARVWLEGDATAYLIWPGSIPDEPIRRALETLCQKVTRVGHSTSLVQAFLLDDPVATGIDWVPANDGEAKQYIRVTTRGLLERLEALHGTAEEENHRNRRRPQISRYQAYTTRRPVNTAQATPGTVFGPPLVFSITPREGYFQRLELRAAPLVISRWRAALLSKSNDLSGEVRALVSGHESDGSPLTRPHLALVPLPFVGHPQATGHLLGLAALIPRDVDPELRRSILRLLGSVSDLRLGPLGRWELSYDFSDRPPRSLQPETWTAYPSGERTWGSVTPVTFDRHPKARHTNTEAYRSECHELIAAACREVGLPTPREVILQPNPPHLGAVWQNEFPLLRRKDGSIRRHQHIILKFDTPVCGPIVLGAGRYRGYGWFRPLPSGDTEELRLGSGYFLGSVQGYQGL